MFRWMSFSSWCGLFSFIFWKTSTDSILFVRLRGPFPFPLPNDLLDINLSSSKPNHGRGKDSSSQTNDNNNKVWTNKNFRKVLFLGFLGISFNHVCHVFRNFELWTCQSKKAQRQKDAGSITLIPKDLSTYMRSIKKTGGHFSVQKNSRNWIMTQNKWNNTSDICLGKHRQNLIRVLSLIWLICE